MHFIVCLIMTVIVIVYVYLSRTFICFGLIRLKISSPLPQESKFSRKWDMMMMMHGRGVVDVVDFKSIIPVLIVCSFISTKPIVAIPQFLLNYKISIYKYYTISC